MPYSRLQLILGALTGDVEHLGLLLLERSAPISPLAIEKLGRCAAALLLGHVAKAKGPN